MSCLCHTCTNLYTNINIYLSMYELNIYLNNFELEGNKDFTSEPEY